MNPHPSAAAADVLIVGAGPAGLALATALAGKPPVATRYILELVHHGAEMPLDEAQHLESTLFGLSASTDDMREGTSAFLAKRPAVWKGR